VTLSGVQNNFEFAMPAGDRYTEGGDYTLRVTASDKAGNEGSAFVQITLQELPLAYHGLVWAGEGIGGGFSVFKQDTGNVTTAGPGGLQGMSDLLMDSRNDQIITCQSAAGTLTGWDFDDFSQIFRTDLPQGTGSATFSGLAMNRSGYFASLRVPAYLRSYRFDGSPKNNFDDAGYPGTAVMATADKVYLGVSGLLGSPRKLDVYDVAGENLEATQVLGWEVMRILAVNDAEIVACGNNNGLAQVLVLDRQSLVRYQEKELQETFIDAVAANGRVWLLTDQGLREFYPGDGSASALLVAGNFSAVGVDATQNRIFLGGANVIEVVTGAGAPLAQWTGSFGNVKFIKTHYNR
ncbi:MAG TPA: hypothetical protein VHS96_08175, partial [Bacteroidia bacterium]|nr:hypothetical protein [Bacteroidia bacterium]